METNTTTQSSLTEAILDVFISSNKPTLKFSDVYPQVSQYGTEGAVRQALVRMARTQRGGLAKAKRGVYRLSADLRTERIYKVMAEYGSPMLKSDIVALSVWGWHAIDSSLATLIQQGRVKKTTLHDGGVAYVAVTATDNTVVEEPVVEEQPSNDAFTIDTASTFHLVATSNGRTILLKGDDGEFYIAKRATLM